MVEGLSNSECSKAVEITNLIAQRDRWKDCS
jgi:hypothetical protein